MRAYSVIVLFCLTIGSISAVCNNLPPGIDRMIRGIDVTSLDLVPTDLTLSNGFMHPILEFTCTTPRKFRNPTDGSIYDIPDQVDSITPIPGGVVDYQSYYYASHSDVKKTEAGKSHSSFFFGMFSSSSKYKKTQETIIDNLNALVELNAHVSAYEVKLKPDAQIKIGDSVKLFFDRLPATYLQGPAEYQEFLSTFGTHFYSSGTFGGYLSYTFEMTERLVQKIKTKEAEHQAALSFFGILKAHKATVKASASVSDEFKKNSRLHEAYYGGNANLMTGNVPNYNQWAATVPKNPWLFSGTLVELLHLLPAGPKRDGLGTAYAVKLDKAYLEDLGRSLEYLISLFYMQKSELRRDKAQLTNYLNQVNGLKNQPIPNHSQVASLGNIIDNYVTVIRNKAALGCLHDRSYCNSNLIHFYYSDTSFYDSYTNKTTFGFDPELVDAL